MAALGVTPEDLKNYADALKAIADQIDVNSQGSVTGPEITAVKAFDPGKAGGVQGAIELYVDYFQKAGATCEDITTFVEKLRLLAGCALNLSQTYTTAAGLEKASADDVASAFSAAAQATSVGSTTQPTR